MFDINIDIDDIKKMDDLILENPLELFFQELAMIFNKKYTDFYGDPKCLNLQKYLYSKYISTSDINNEIRQYVMNNSYYSNLFKWEVETAFLDTPRKVDVLHIVFNVYSDGNIYTNQYIIGS